jgi:hypothetical protein
MREYTIICRDEIEEGEYSYYQHSIFADSLNEAWQYAKANFDNIYTVS